MNKATGHNLPPLAFEWFPSTPLPQVIEDDSDEAWRLWDAAVAMQEAKGERGR